MEHEEEFLVEIFSVPDETGAPDTVGGWTWRYVAYPSHGVHAFGPPPFASQEEAIESAGQAYPDVQYKILE